MIPHVWGIFRERQHSPGREFDDTEILKLVAKHVEAAGYQVHLKTPEELEATDHPSTGLRTGPSPSLVFLMCERLEALGSLEPLERKGIPHVNPLQAVLNTYRDRMIARLHASGVPMPQSHIISSNSSEPGHPSTEPVVSYVEPLRTDPLTELRTGPFPIWVKRADVHNTQSGDVELTRSPEELQAVLAALSARGITRAVLQRHVPGDLIKFYGIGKPCSGSQQEAWFRWFYHRDQELRRHPFSEGALQELTQRAASALGLEVYGGDAIVTPRGEICVIDINAWPSFALYREEASLRIAQWLLLRLREGAIS